MSTKSEKEPRTSDVPITGRKLAVRLPSEWLDRMLVALSEIDPEHSAEEALGAVLDAAAAALPRVSFGVRVTDPRDSSSVLVLRRSPDLISAEPPLTGPLFPELSAEEHHPVVNEPSAVLAIAAKNPEDLPEGTTGAALASRLSLSLGTALRITDKRSRLHAAVSPSASHVDAVNTDRLATLGRVVASVVHELNNPVTAILAYSEYLRRKAERGTVDATDIERIARIEEAARRIFGFSRELIAYARPSSEVAAPLVIHDVIDRALMFCEHVLGRAKVRVERSFGEIRPVRGIGGQLAQVFVNLFTNAANAMQEGGGTLTIFTSFDAEHRTVCVTVLDTGIGIAEHALSRIFEPFFTTSADGDGTGLGLSIVRDIVLAHRGRVWAERRPGAGAVFHVVLPALTDD